MRTARDLGRKRSSKLTLGLGSILRSHVAAKEISHQRIFAVRCSNLGTVLIGNTPAATVTAVSSCVFGHVSTLVDLKLPFCVQRTGKLTPIEALIVAILDRSRFAGREFGRAEVAVLVAAVPH